MMYVSRLVGGQYFNRNRPGDPDAKPAMQLMDPKRQREALNMLAGSILKDDYFATEADLFNDLAPSRWMDWASNPSVRVDFPVHQTVQSMQSFALLGLVSPQVLQRVYDAELKSKADDKFTAAELIKDVRDSIWRDLDTAKAGDDTKYTDAKPMISSLRRNLQRQHLAFLLATAQSPPGMLTSPDLQSMVRYALRELNGQIAAAMDKAKLPDGGTRLDFATRAHLVECRDQIDKSLGVQHVKNVD